MNKLSRLTALLLALMILLGSVSLAEGGLPIGGTSGLTSDDWADLVDAAEEKLFFTDEGDTGKEITPAAPEQPEKPAFYPYTDIEELTLIQSETAAEASITASGAAILTHEAAGQWQIAIGGVWANLYGETSSTLTVTSAMMNGRSSAEIRKALGDKNAETGEYVAYTQTAVINLIEAAPAMFSVNRDATDMVASDANDGIMTLEMANQENMVIVQVIYRIKDTDQPVADAYIGQIAKGSALNTSLTLPRVTGYLARACTVVPAILVDKNITTFTEQTADTAGSLTINVTQEVSQQDITIYVDYEPAEVTFTVKHMQQNITDDDYTEVETNRQTLTGKTGEQVGDKLAKTYEGFSAIWYDPTTAIAADGSTVVEIRYNREYYLLTFDLGGGYGVEPIFAKFGTTVGDVGTPSRAGYTFAGWSLDGTNKVDLPSTIPAEHRKYTALWNAANTSFTVQYWLEDANNPGEYWPWYSQTVSAATGLTVDGKDYCDVDGTHATEAQYYTLAKYDESVTVAGDDSTTLNVYYNRNSYTLRFYYARLKGNDYQVTSSTDGSSKENGTIPEASWTGEYSIEPSLDPKYEKKTCEISDGTNTHTYLYFDLTAKYGQNIQDIWPNAPITNDIDGASGNIKFVSWGTQYGSGYNTANERNRNIKGPYAVFDDMLLKNAAVTSDIGVNHELVAYWGGPTMYNYEIYYSLLEGETADRKYGDEGYKHQVTYAVGSTDKPSGQSALTFEGITFKGKEFDGDDIKPNYDYKPIRFYYTRNSHAVTFDNQFGSTVNETMTYGAPLADLAATMPAIPAGYDASHTFGGWYIDKACTMPADFSITMPDNSVEYYAQWVLNTYKVRFFLTEDRIEKGEVFHPSGADNTASFDNVPHGSLIDKTFVENYLDDNAMHASKPNAPYDFAGWYYRDETGQEVRFAVDSMPIKSDMDIYAKWTSDTPVEFTFKYQDETGNQLAEDYTGLALPFTPVTMSAKIGTDLTMAPANEDPMRYIPAVSSHTLNIDVDPTKNVFVFTYSLPGTVEYTVQYLAAKTEVIDGKTVLVPDKSKEPLWPEKKGETPNAIVTENYMPVLGYMPQATQLRLIVSTEEENVIQFLYLPNETNEYFNATHIIVDHNKQEKEYFSEKGMKGTIGQLVAVNKQNISGYAFSRAEVMQTSYNDTAEQWETETVPAKEPNGDTVQHILTDGGMHVYLYYEPVQYPVIVRHLKAGTTDTLLADETITAAYGSTLNAENFAKVDEVNEAQDVDYRVSSYDPLTHTVKVDDGTALAENVIIIYYEPDVADISITKEIVVLTGENTIEPSDEDMKTEFEFTVKLTNSEKEQTEAYVTIDAVQQEMTATDGTLTFTLQDGQTAIIHDLWVGTQYEIKEADYDSFTTTYSVTNTGTLTALDVDMKVANTFPKYAGELTIKKTDMQENKESAIVKATVGGVDYYLVLNGSNGYTATITGIRPNTDFTVSEINDWTWQYRRVDSISGKISADNMTPTITIQNTKETDQWLHDESHVENNFGTGQSTGVNQ